jgi:hypothetical protein
MVNFSRFSDNQNQKSLQGQKIETVQGFKVWGFAFGLPTSLFELRRDKSIPQAGFKVHLQPLALKG